MRFPSSQALRSLRLGIFPNRAYCAFHRQRHVDTSKSASVYGTAGAESEFISNSRNRSRRSQFSSVPLKLSDQHRHRDHDNTCMEAHLGDAVHVFSYLELLNEAARKLWQEMKTSRREAGVWDARARYRERQLEDEEDVEEREHEEVNEEKEDGEGTDDERDHEKDENGDGYSQESVPFRDREMFEIERSEDLYDLIKENKTRMDRANELLEVIMDKFVASAILYFDKAYDASDEDEDNAFMNTAFKKYLEAVLCAYSAYHLQQDFRKVKQREFLSSRDPPFSKERRRVREIYDCSMKIELACRENYEEERTRLLEDYGRKCRDPGPRGLLTEQNMAINMVPETQRYPVSQRSFESNRDSQTGRPILPDIAYVAAPAQVSQDLQNLYDLRKTFRRAEADHRNGVENLKNAKALRMGILKNLPDEHFQEHFQANLGFTPEEHEARLRESMEAAREAYDEARRAIRQDLDQLPAVSESSFAARTSDYIENGSAPGSYNGRIRRSGDPALYNWQRAAASEISANGQRTNPSEPSSLYNGASLRVGERVSPSVRSDFTEARKYRARRKKWMRRKRASVTSRRS